MQQTITKGDVLQRIGGLSFIVGAIVVAVFNILHPRTSEASFDDIQPLLEEIADTSQVFWQVDHLLLAVGIWALTIGWIGVYRSITTGAAAAWTRLGFYGVIIGTAIWTVLFAIDIGWGLVVEQWATNPEPAKSTWFVVSSAFARINFLLFTMSAIVYWLALLFVGIGMALSTVYPKWTGWILILLGIATVGAVGLPQVFTGPNNVTTNILFPILSVLTLVWALVVGIWVARKAW